MTNSREVRWYRSLNQPSALLKQAPSLFAFVLALVATFTMSGLATPHPELMWFASLAMLASTALAIVFTATGKSQHTIVMLVPVVDIVAFGLFRASSGGGGSLFASLVLIPIVWLATGPGIRYVLLVFVLSCGTVMLPYLSEPPQNRVELLRGVIVPLIYATVAAVINELSRQQRARAEQAERLAAQRTRALAENEAMITQLRESESRYRTLLESHESLWASITAQAVIATDCAGLVSAWNPGAERMLGLTEEETVGRVTLERFLTPAMLAQLTQRQESDPEIQALKCAAANTAPQAGGSASHNDLADDDQAVAALFARANSGATIDEELEIQTGSGTRMPARVTVTRRNDGAGQQLGYLLVVTDETRQAEVARMKDQFVGMISHELRTPLSAIIGFLDLLRNDPEQPLTEQQIEFVDIIERNAKRLLALVGDLLFTAQVESGRFPIAPHQLELTEAVRLAVESARPGAENEGVALTLELPEHPVDLTADPGRLGQSIDNLISNAVKFTPRGGSVTVTVREEPSQVVLSVSDTGIGIPKAEQADLFNRFFRASTATQNAIPGVGLGLNITHAIAAAHGGRIDVTSEPGVGTTFEMVLPTAPTTQSISVIV